MSDAGSPRILALMAQEERPVLLAAGQQIALHVGAATGGSWPARLHFLVPGAPVPDGAALVASLLAEVEREEPIADVAARWHDRIAAWQAAGVARILLCTLFRHVADPVARGARAERIRQLNRLAMQLSRDHGIEIVDVDRLLALVGARAIGADYRCLGPRAAAVAGHAIAAAILNGPLGPGLDPVAQERAAQLHGGVGDVALIVDRYLPGAVPA